MGRRDKPRTALAAYWRWSTDVAGENPGPVLVAVGEQDQENLAENVRVADFEIVLYVT